MLLFINLMFIHTIIISLTYDFLKNKKKQNLILFVSICINILFLFNNTNVCALIKKENRYIEKA